MLGFSSIDDQKPFGKGSPSGEAFGRSLVCRAKQAGGRAWSGDQGSHATIVDASVIESATWRRPLYMREKRCSTLPRHGIRLQAAY